MENKVAYATILLVISDAGNQMTPIISWANGSFAFTREVIANKNAYKAIKINNVLTFIIKEVK